MPSWLQMRGQRRGERKQTHLGIAGLGVLRRLGNVFCDHLLVFERLGQPHRFDRSLGRTPVRRVFRIGYRHGFQCRIAQCFERQRLQWGIVPRPQHQRPPRIGNGRARQTGRGNLLRERKIGCQEQ